MHAAGRGFLLALAASAGGAVVSGAAAALVLSLHPPGVEGPHPGLWLAVVLPVAAALACAGALARSAGGVLLNAAAFLLPQAVAALGVFFFFAHPGGHGGEGLVLATGEFWAKLGAVYALVAALVGAAARVFRLARR